MKRNEPPVLAACFNQSYVPHVATMLRSFADSGTGPARWYLFNDDSVKPDVNRRLLEHARACGLNVKASRIPGHLLAGFDAQSRYPLVAWYRTVLAEALPQEDRLIYIDSDTLVLHDVTPLWNTRLGDGHYFGAVCHPSYGGGRRHKADLGMDPDSPYFNSGVMVMDLAMMRKGEFGPRTRSFATTPGRRDLRFADQDAMNVLFSGQWTALDPTWNCVNSILLPVMSGASWADDRHHDPLILERAARSPAVVHFDGPPVLRPWNRRCINPFAGLYRRYRATTPWPLARLEARRRDILLSRIPPGVQARLWRLRGAGVR